jgi:hypothetical protein
MKTVPLQILVLVLIFAVKLAGSTRTDDSGHVDLARVDERTGQLTLYAVPSEPLDNRGAVDRLRRKLHAYARMAKSARVFQDQGTANPGLLPKLAVIVSAPVSSVERENLDGIKLQYRDTDLSFGIEEIAPGATGWRER